MTFFPAIVGVLLLAFGRRLYWLFVGGIGFVVGLWFVNGLTSRPPDLPSLLIAFGAGVVGAVLALFLQRFAVVAAGLLAGAWLGAELWRAFAVPPPKTPWLPALLGGVLGALLSATLFDAVLIVLSSLVGAALLAELFGGRRGTQAAVFVLLSLLGIVFQARSRRPEAPRPA